jgi:hypothetical protein
MAGLIEGREAHSESRLEELRRKLGKLPALQDCPTLAVYTTGSYARFDASKHSDVDLFFVNYGDQSSVGKLQSTCLFADIIRAARDLDYPEFSSDGQYLEIHDHATILAQLGGRDDDPMNCFTARRLLLLESAPVVNAEIYNKILAAKVEAYCRDFEQYEGAFKPTFLINDIMRFWKTLCLNYEYDRNIAQEREEYDVQHTIRNFKLKFSRLLTCFSMIVALASDAALTTPPGIITLCRMRPRQRLIRLVEQRSDCEPLVRRIIDLYAYFLEATALPTIELEGKFKDTAASKEAFERAAQFGDGVFDLLQAVTRENRYLRYVVV